MAKSGMNDKYANLMIARVEESAANTLTFQEMPQVTTLLEKKAYLVNRIVYNYNSALLTTDTDRVNFGISLSNRWTSPNMTEPTIIDINEILCVASGTPATLLQPQTVITKDFSTMPGGGILLPTRPMYLWVVGANLSAAQTVVARFYFTIVDLQQSDYWDLVESLQAFS